MGVQDCRPLMPKTAIGTSTLLTPHVVPAPDHGRRWRAKRSALSAWMFAQRLAGVSVARIARMLNERGVPCPSDVDRERNPHRSGHAWTLRTVAAILSNPRYTGRQVWNRQNSGATDATARGWNAPQEWAISTKRSHPALVSDDDFVAAQAIRATRPTQDGSPRGPAEVRVLRAPSGFALGERTSRLSMPPRLHQRQTSRGVQPEVSVYT